ncbi:MAG: hypothetical protein KME47_09360 [Nodosilinea sp. WJT8-NPBG4]|jgi:hypothetical protein|nr:hypothetical protein [Nodosilinea sp. WJT8-NPBG4]
MKRYIQYAALGICFAGAVGVILGNYHYESNLTPCEELTRESDDVAQEIKMLKASGNPVKEIEATSLEINHRLQYQLKSTELGCN